MKSFCLFSANSADDPGRADPGRHTDADGVYRRGQPEGVVPASVPHPLLPPLPPLHGGPPLLQPAGQPVGPALQQDGAER